MYLTQEGQLDLVILSMVLTQGLAARRVAALRARRDATLVLRFPAHTTSRHDASFKLHHTFPGWSRSKQHFPDFHSLQNSRFFESHVGHFIKPSTLTTRMPGILLHSRWLRLLCWPLYSYPLLLLLSSPRCLWRSVFFSRHGRMMVAVAMAAEASKGDTG